MAQADQTAARYGHPGPELMEAAGRAVARAIQRHVRRCRVSCWPARATTAATAILPRGCWRRMVGRSAWPRSPRRGSDPRPPLRPASGPAPWSRFRPEEAARSDVVVDAVFGAGLTRPVDALVAETLKAARRVVAVDVPSGLDGATGLPLGYVPRRTDGHVLSAETWTPPAARPRPVRTHRTRRYRHSGWRAG